MKYFCTLIVAAAILSTHSGFAASRAWLGAEFGGVDSVSGKPCSVKVDQNIDESIFGDTITVVTTIGTESESFRLTNRLFFGGSTYGKGLYLTSVEKDAQGVLVSFVDEFWVELSVDESGDQAQFESLHLGTTQGGLIIRYPKGTQNKCVLKKI